MPMNTNKTESKDEKRKEFFIRLSLVKMFCVLLIIATNHNVWGGCFCVNGDGYVNQIPKSIEQSDRDFEARKERIIRFVIRNYELSDFSGKNFLNPYARIAAGLTAIKEGYNVEGNENFTDTVEQWTSTIDRGSLDPGTWYVDEKNRANLDFHMIRLIPILYLFKDDKIDDKFLLSNRSCKNIIGEIFEKYVGQNEWVDYCHGVLANPETENHVLMTLSSIYLINQWIYHNYRGFSEDEWKDVLGRIKWNRLSREDRYNNFDNHGKELEDKIFQTVGRILHNGYFETNATAYQNKSVAALLNLYSFSDTLRMRTAAENALNYTAAKFAFQSFEGHRWPPARRSHRYANQGMYYADGIIDMMAALSGVCNWVDSCPRIPSCENYQEGAMELFPILLNYRLPSAIHDYMLNKHTGYWARMQARFDQDYYRYGTCPEYFHFDGSVVLNEDEMISAPEFYFVTNRFMNSSGGSFKRLRRRDSDNPKHYDFYARPHVLFTRGGSGQCYSYDDDEKEKDDPYEEDKDGPISENFMYMLGQSDFFWKSRNSGTYKSFSYGYQTNLDHSYPMKIPRSWERFQYLRGHQHEFSHNTEDRVRFSFYDLSKVPKYRFYVVVARVSKDLNDPTYRNISRGFWEIVPKERYGSIEDLVRYVLDNNCCSAFSNVANENYRYKMTTGETVEIVDFLGEDLETEPIVRITDPNGEELDIATHTYAHNKEAIASMPLMEVREVDRNYQFTGRIFAYARGDGRLEVFNPFVGQVVIADSSNFRYPQSEYKKVRRTCGTCYPRLN